MSDEYKIKINTSVQLTEIRQLEQIIQGVNMELGAMGARFATKLPSAITASIKAFGQEELAVEKLSAAIRHNGGMVSEADILFAKFPVAFSMSFKASMAFNASSAFALSCSMV